MGALTGVLYGCLLTYLGGWYIGRWSGNFSLLLFVLTVCTLFYWLAERFHFAPARLASVAELEKRDAARQVQLAHQGIAQVDGDIGKARASLLAQPWWLDWTAGLFPVILVVFLLRSFLFEPFKIPSGSMVPTLLVGDLILVNKFRYGVRLPIINKKIFQLRDPERGDVMVFRYPLDASTDYIKRVVGLPGDEVVYRRQQLYLNGQLVDTRPTDDFYDESSVQYSKQFYEKLGQLEHRMLVDREGRMPDVRREPFPFNENCRYSTDEIKCTVPADHYFVMGDNRDRSADSRVWGFVPDQNIVGKAFFIWMNFSDLKRFGPFN